MKDKNKSVENEGEICPNVATNMENYKQRPVRF